MVHFVSRVLIAVLFFGLAGCGSSGVSTNHTLTPGSPYGLAFFRMRTHPSVHRATLHFTQYDDMTGKAFGSSIPVTQNNIGSLITGVIAGEGDSYHLVELNPGSYVVEGSITKTKGNTIVHCSRSVVHFRIAPGRVAYLGEFDLTDTGSVFGKENILQNQDAALEELTQYKDINGEFYVANLSDVPFVRRERYRTSTDVFPPCRAKMPKIQYVAPPPSNDLMRSKVESRNRLLKRTP